MDWSKYTIVPRPLEIDGKNGQFTVNSNTRIIIEKGNKALRPVADYLSNRFKQVSGFDLRISEEKPEAPENNTILLTSDGMNDDLGPEGYKLVCNPVSVELRGKPAGVFYAVQTLFQLLPPEIYSPEKSADQIDWRIPAVSIVDKPRFQWRGMHLDVGRHLFPVEFIKRYLDYLAMHKFNVFHWHLTDDQGWRIEIKKYPRLTTVGAWRDSTLVGHSGQEPQKFDGIRYGGFYTQEEIRDIVQYASERFITVVPEIEMPGHSVAALTAYPNLSCTGGPFKVRQVWGIAEDIYCAGNEQVFQFLEDVLSEVLTLFPSKYIHIGGDEAPKDRWEQCAKCQKRIADEHLADEHALQSYFIRRIESFLNSRGRQIIGWDEILEGGLAPNAAVMSWRGTEGGIAAAREKHFVVMSPTNYCYFDYYQSDPDLEPLAIGGFLPLEKVYEFEPVPDSLTADESGYILGAQGNVWTEYMKTPEDVEYMAIPRMCALAEVVWSAEKNRNLDDFLRRMAMHYNRLDATDADYYWPALSGFASKNVFIDQTEVEIKNQRIGSKVHYTLDGSEPLQTSPLYTGPLHFNETTSLAVREFMPDGKASRIYNAMFIKKEPMEPLAAPENSSGIQYQFYPLNEPVQSTKALADLDSFSTGKSSVIAFPEIELPEYFGLKFSGYIKVPATGIYTFYTESNDGSCLYIGQELVVDNDGSHGAVERSGQTALKKGLYPILVTYLQEGGAKMLKVSVKGPGLDKIEIPEEMYY